MKILIISGDNYDDSEMLYPYYRLLEEGYDVDVAAKEKREIAGKYHFKIDANKTFDEINAADYDGLLLPGGTAPEKVRQEETVLKAVKEFADSKKPIASICHGQQVLISAKVLNGVTATCYPGIRDDIINAGADYVNEQVVVCGNFVTSRRPQDLPYFMKEFTGLLKL